MIGPRFMGQIGSLQEVYRESCGQSKWNPESVGNCVGSRTKPTHSKRDAARSSQHSAFSKRLALDQLRTGPSSMKPFDR
jgi:hypothetical protein